MRLSQYIPKPDIELNDYNEIEKFKEDLMYKLGCYEWFGVENKKSIYVGRSKLNLWSRINQHMKPLYYRDIEKFESKKKMADNKLGLRVWLCNYPTFLEPLLIKQKKPKQNTKSEIINCPYCIDGFLIVLDNSEKIFCPRCENEWIRNEEKFDDWVNL